MGGTNKDHMLNRLGNGNILVFATALCAGMLACCVRLQSGTVHVTPEAPGGDLAKCCRLYMLSNGPNVCLSCVDLEAEGRAVPG